MRSPQRWAGDLGVGTGRALGAAVLVALAWFAGPAGAAEEPVPLFDGRTLDGWKATEMFMAGPVVVEDGAIVLKRGQGRMTGVTSTRADLPRLDYELTFEARKVEGDDFFAAATFPVGDAFVTLVNGGWGGSVTGLSSLNGADASENETTRFVDYKPGTWYRFRVRVTASSIRCRIDDAEVVAVRHAGRQLKTRIEVRGNQPLGFAAYETVGAVRAVAVRKLTPAEVEATEVAED